MKSPFTFHFFMFSCLFVSISDEFSLENTYLYSTNPCTIGRSRFCVRCEHCSVPFCPRRLLILFIVFSSSCLPRIARKMRVHSQSMRLVGFLDSSALIYMRLILIFESLTRFPLNAEGTQEEYRLVFLVSCNFSLALFLILCRHLILAQSRR